MKKKSILVGTAALGLLTATSIYSCKNADKVENTTENAAEAKCGEGKCGNSTKAADSTSMKTKEGKCGEGKCGDSTKAADSASMKTKEGKCGEGKCGGKK